MKKALLLLAALAAVSVVAVSPPALPVVHAAGICDPQRSLLCRGLIAFWDFETSGGISDYGDQDKLADLELIQYPGSTVTYTTGKIGSYALVTTNSTWLFIPRWGDLPSYMTVAAWVKISDATANVQIIRTTDPLASGNEGTSLGLYGGKTWIVNYEDETDTTSTYTGVSALSTNTWHAVVWKISPYGTYGKAQACTSVDGAAFTCANLNYNHRVSAGDLSVGGVCSAGTCYMDGLVIAARAWSPADVAQYYNSGSGRAFPFY